MENNISHYITVGVVSVFPALRRAIGVIGFMSVIIGGLWAYGSRHQPVATAANPNPVCNRVAYMTTSEIYRTGGRPIEWGEPVVAKNATYVREANGTGYCLIKRGPGPFLNGDVWVTKYYEVPSKYSTFVAGFAPPPKNVNLLAAIGLIGFGGILLIGLWLPATILAAVGRKLLRNAKEPI